MFVMNKIRPNGALETYLTKRILLSWRPSGRKYLGKQKGVALTKEEF